MSELVKFSFYNVTACGYYARSDDSPVFGSLREILEDLRIWSIGKSIAQTKLYEPAEGSDFLSTYLLNINSQDGDWLLSTWNETPSTEAGVASIVRDSPLTNPVVVMNEIQANSIPGYATYFWFLPGEDLFASVRLKKRTQTGQKPMQKYLESALSKVSSYTFTEPTMGRIIGYGRPGEEPLSLHPRFRTSLASNPGNRELILQNSEQISRVYRKETLHLNRAEQRSRWQSMLRMIGLNQGQEFARNDDVNLRYDFSPEFIGSTDVVSILGEWDRSSSERSDWDDYGFSFVGDSNKIHWLSHDLLTTEFHLDVDWDTAETVNAESLMSALMQMKPTILRSIAR